MIGDERDGIGGHDAGRRHGFCSLGGPARGRAAHCSSRCLNGEGDRKQGECCAMVVPALLRVGLACGTRSGG